LFSNVVGWKTPSVLKRLRNSKSNGVRSLNNVLISFSFCEAKALGLLFVNITACPSYTILNSVIHI